MTMISASRPSHLGDHGRLLRAGGNSHRSTGSQFWRRWPADQRQLDGQWSRPHFDYELFLAIQSRQLS
jgi:hypothetical protein